MPTYLTPGVYVEEVPAQSKPIEGVGTSTAAFVGLTPGGPVNTPMRLSNWTQFARTFGDPHEPENGPFMPGAYLRTRSMASSRTEGPSAGSCALATTTRLHLPRSRCAPPATRRWKRSGPSRSRRRTGPSMSRSRRSRRPVKPARAKSSPAPTFRLVITAGSDREVFDGLTTKKGRWYIVTKVNAGSKLIRLEETGASLPEAQRIPATGSYELSLPSVPAGQIEAKHFAGDVARREGIGGLAAIDEITMVCAPDLMTLAENGSDAHIRDLQGKMIAHCEKPGTVSRSWMPLRG